MAADAAEPAWWLDVEGQVHVPFGPFQGVTVKDSQCYCHDCARFLEHLLNYVQEALDGLVPGPDSLDADSEFACMSSGEPYDSPAACGGCHALLEYCLTDEGVGG